MQYTVFVANQGSLIRVDVPEHLAEMEGSDQELSNIFHSLAQKYHHDVFINGPFKCVACGDQANNFTNHPVQTQGEILDSPPALVAFVRAWEAKFAKTKFTKT